MPRPAVKGSRPGGRRSYRFPVSTILSYRLYADQIRCLRSTRRGPPEPARWAILSRSPRWTGRPPDRVSARIPPACPIAQPRRIPASQISNLKSRARSPGVNPPLRRSFLILILLLILISSVSPIAPPARAPAANPPSILKSSNLKSPLLAPRLEGPLVRDSLLAPPARGNPFPCASPLHTLLTFRTLRTAGDPPGRGARWLPVDSSLG